MVKRSNDGPIPRARERLRWLAKATERGDISVARIVSELKDIEAAMYRKPPVMTTRAKTRKVTASMAQEIRAYHQSQPDLSQLELASRFGVNPGRVSEALNGLR